MRSKALRRPRGMSIKALSNSFLEDYVKMKELRALAKYAGTIRVDIAPRLGEVNAELLTREQVRASDAIVNLGVTEHLPDYKCSLATYRRLLKPGGKIYLDASACQQKYKFHSFIYKHILSG